MGGGDINNSLQWILISNFLQVTVISYSHFKAWEQESLVCLYCLPLRPGEDPDRSVSLG